MQVDAPLELVVLLGRGLRRLVLLLVLGQRAHRRAMDLGVLTKELRVLDHLGEDGELGCGLSGSGGLLGRLPSLTAPSDAPSPLVLVLVLGLAEQVLGLVVGLVRLLALVALLEVVGLGPLSPHHQPVFLLCLPLLFLRPVHAATPP